MSCRRVMKMGLMGEDMGAREESDLLESSDVSQSQPWELPPKVICHHKTEHQWFQTGRRTDERTAWVCHLKLFSR